MNLKNSHTLITQQTFSSNNSLYSRYRENNSKLSHYKTKMFFGNVVLLVNISLRTIIYYLSIVV